MATGKISVKHGNGMVFVLSMIVKTIEVEQIETKLKAIEQEQRSKSA